MAYTLGKKDMFERPWPKDLPNTCPSCGKAFRSDVNLVIGPGKGARRLKGLAFGMIIPWMIIAVGAFALGGMPNSGRAGGYAIIGLIFIPPAVIALASIFFPLSRRVICTCGWCMEYAILPDEKEAQQDVHGNTH